MKILNAFINALLVFKILGLTACVHTRDLKPRLDSHLNVFNEQGKFRRNSSAWDLYESLDPNSNEAKLIQRTALYLSEGKKEDAFNTSSDAVIRKDVEKVISGKNFQEIWSMISEMSPVHRLKAQTLKGVDLLRMLISLDFMSEILQNPFKFTQKKVNIFAKYFSFLKLNNLSSLISLSMVEYANDKYKHDPSVRYTFKLDDCNKVNFHECILDINKKLGDKANTRDKKLVKDIITYFYDNIKVGIGHHTDYVLGTDKYVFGVLGIHRNDEYGKIAIALNKSILSDPQTWTTLTAASAHYGAWYGAKAGRPWVSEKPWDKGGESDYKLSKIVNGKPGVLALVVAADLLARVRAYDVEKPDPSFEKIYRALNKDYRAPDASIHFSNISASDIRRYMESLSASSEGNHMLPEIHLPVTPIEKIDIIVMSNAVGQMPIVKNLINIPSQKIVKVLESEINGALEKYSAPQ